MKILKNWFKRKHTDIKFTKDLIFKKLNIGKHSYVITDVTETEFEITIKLKDYEKYKNKNTVIEFIEFID